MPALDKLSRVADVSYTVARRAGSLALSAVRQVAGAALDRRSPSRTPSTRAAPPPPSDAPRATPPGAAAPSARTSATAAPPEPADTPAADVAAVPTPAAAAAPPPRDHVSREPVVVAESADAGAADGAGAQITVGEPWKGYGKLTAREVNDRLATAGPEALAIARLYESAHRNRVTVLREIDRRLAAGEG